MNKFIDSYSIAILKRGKEPQKKKGFEEALKVKEFFLIGNMWTISYEGKTIHLQDSIGLQYIHYLLDNQYKEFYLL